MFNGSRQIAAAADFLKTAEVAHRTRQAEQTLRKHHCRFGHYLGVKPIKVGRDLLWPTSEIDAAIARLVEAR